MRRRRGKYGAVKATVDGIRFDSKLEAARWQELLLLQKAGMISGLQRQVPFDLTLNGHLICRYVADFVYTTTETGETTVEDAKGILTPEFRLKAKMMEACHGIVVQIWTGKPRWALDVNRGKWLRETRPASSRKTLSAGGGSRSNSSSRRRGTTTGAG